MHNQEYIIVTGASEGFGRALAIECATRGFNVILVALPGTELRELAAHIQRHFNVSALYFEHDLSKKEECYRLFKHIHEKKLSIQGLINNAGLGGTHLFEDRDPVFYHRQIALNVIAPTLLSHYFIALLRQHSRSYILNVSSLAGMISVPGKQVYGGTKSYLLSFSRNLRKELKKTGVQVSVICPGGMNTTLQQIVQNRELSGISRWSVMEPQDVARIAITGMLEGRELIIPGAINRVFVLIEKIVPSKVKDLLLRSQNFKTQDRRFAFGMVLNK